MTPQPTISASPPAAAQRPQRRLRLQTKTMILLVTLLTISVGICGIAVYRFAAANIDESNRRHTNELAYTISATTSDPGAFSAGDFQRDISHLQKISNVRFAAFIGMDGKVIAVSANDPVAWQEYNATIGQTATADLGLARRMTLHHNAFYITTVPYFSDPGDGLPRELIGRIHVATDSESSLGSLHYIQGAILLTCMVVVILSVPAAAMISRHITIPIQTLAAAAHGFADGTLTEPVAIRRNDELGELVDAFNRMTSTVRRQQQDILDINAGLEAAVKTRTQELERVNSRLKSEISEKEDFLRAVSHDLNAPLRNIAGMASMLLLKYQKSLEADAVQRLQRIQKNVEVECELINELLELSRLKSRREKIEKVDLHILIQTLTEQFSNDLETRRITLSVNGRLPVMQGERARLRQAFQNLIDNSIKYMREEGPREINISGHASDGDYILTFSDTGMGIPAEDIPGLFHVFRRAKNVSIAKIPGKGVGLASVKSIIDNYGGRMWAESIQGQGATFHVAVPLSHFEKLQPAKQEVAA